MSSPDTAWPHRPALTARISSRWRRDLVFFFVAAVVIALDQLTKWLIRSHLGLYESWPVGSQVGFVHVLNSGAAFGILQGQTSFLIVTSLLGLGAILLYYVYPPMDHGIIRLALGMQLGGAIGNLSDRIRVGAVTDFIHVGRFPTFNIADASITTSVIVVLLFFAFQEDVAAKERAAATSPPPPDAGADATPDD
ncbi:MAG: signal peptidase II [Dehalococcoidia bacterium]|nr:signal peptidase II [Dehalococcoidia bacterium]